MGIKNLVKHNRRDHDVLSDIYDDVLNTRFIKWVDSLLLSRWGIYLLPVIVFIDVYFLILPLEPILILYAIRHAQISVFKISAIASLVSLLGYLTLYAVGYYFSVQTLSFVGSIIGMENIAFVETALVTPLSLGIITISLATIFAGTAALASVPIPLSAFTFGVGVLQIAFWPFVVTFMIGRFIRYYLTTYIGRRYGPALLRKILTNITFLAASVVLFVIALWFLLS